MIYKQGLFQYWVPKPLQLFLIAFFNIVLLCVSGISMGNSGDMVSWMGALPEHMAMANNASSIGMLLAFPVIMRTQRYFTSKQLFVGNIFILCFLSFVSYYSNSPQVIIFCSLLFGFFRLVALVEVIFPVMAMLSPKGDRIRFYSVFYPASIIFAQVSAYLFTQVAYDLQWHYAYLVMIVAMLFVALLAMIFMHGYRSDKKIPLYGIDWLGLTLLGISFMFLNYVLSFAKQQDWFVSEKIILSTTAFLLTLIVFLWRQTIRRRHYINLSIFKKRNVYNSLIMLFFMGMFLATSTMQSSLTAGVFNYDSPTNSLINLAMIPGAILAGFFANAWFHRKGGLKVFILLAFSCHMAYCLIMYFMVAPVIQIEYLILPMALKGMGMAMCYIGIGLYGAQTLNIKEFLSAVTIIIAFRSFIGTAFWSAVVAWGTYKLQLQHLTNFAGETDAMNFIAEERGDGVSLYSPMMKQATLTAVKQLYGFMIIAGSGVLVYIALHRFKPINKRRLILLRKKLYGEKHSKHQLARLDGSSASSI